MKAWPDSGTIVSLVRRTRRDLRGHDLVVYSAALTCYAALTAAPGALAAIRLASALVGPDRVIRLSNRLAAALPDDLGARSTVRSLFEHGIQLHWFAVLAGLFVATLYGEGLRRTFGHLTGARESWVGQKGRLLVLPLLVATPVLVLALLGVSSSLASRIGHGAWATILGVVLAYCVDWAVLSVATAWVFYAVVRDGPPGPAALLGAVVTASFLAGFAEGFVVFLGLPLDLGAPFGGLTAIGAVSAGLLWALGLHLVLLVGFVTTKAAVRL